VRQKLDVVINAKLRMMATLEEDLDASRGIELVELLIDLLDR
jgi:hypothetical protein